MADHQQRAIGRQLAQAGHERRGRDQRRAGCPDVHELVELADIEQHGSRVVAAQALDASLEREVAPSAGFAGLQYVNAGRVDNNGIEVLLRGTPVKYDKATWDFSFNVSTDNNKVVSLGSVTAQNFVAAGTYVQHHIGYPVGSWFQKKLVSAQLDGSGNATNVMCETASGGTALCSTPGDSMLVYLGRNTPKVDGGFSSTLTLFHNLRLFGQVDFKTGFSKLDGNQRVRCFFFGLCRENYVPQDYDPVLIAGYQDGYPSVLIHDASFAKLRELSLSYRFNRDQLAGIGFLRQFQALSIELIGRNLFTVTPYDSYDPEVGSSGGDVGSAAIARVDGYAYPNFRTFSAGIQVTF